MSKKTKEKITLEELIYGLKYIITFIKKRWKKKLYTNRYRKIQLRVDRVFAIIAMIAIVIALLGNVIARKLNYDNIVVSNAVGTTAQVNEWDLRLHKHKSLGSKVIDTLDKGEKVTLTGHIYHSRAIEYDLLETLSGRYDYRKGKIMVEVVDGTQTGWVAKDYLNLEETVVIPQRPKVQLVFNIVMLIITIVCASAYIVAKSIIIIEDELFRRECKKKS